LRRHPEAKWRRAPADVARLAELQAELLEALVPRLRPGGRLVYSVCTFTDEEGVRQIAALRARHPELAVERPSDPRLASLLDGEGALRTWPQRHDADAFYAVRLRRME
jgi:16S rRNA (cytosine967-C5)-methyltransferase